VIKILNENQNGKEFFKERIIDYLKMSKHQINNILNENMNSFCSQSSVEELQKFSSKAKELKDYTNKLQSISDTRKRV